MHMLLHYHESYFSLFADHDYSKSFLFSFLSDLLQSVLIYNHSFTTHFMVRLWLVYLYHLLEFL